jgi:hypothetical protein
MDGSRFDALARGLAQGRSRRSVLKGVGAATLGALGLARFGGSASAGGGNSICAHWCHANYSGSDAGACTSDAAHGVGPCYECGPAAPAGNGLQYCGGVCISNCTALDQCHIAGVCDPSTQACTNPAATDGAACDDGDACTQTDTCQAGVCIGGNPVVCTASDQCHVAGVCDPATGQCSNPNATDNTPCDDGNACTQSDTCQAGTCVGGDPVVCEALDQCHVPGVCDPSTGQCTNPNATDNTSCDDGNACTTDDVCVAGVCTGTPVTCPAANACQDSVACDPTTGACVASNKADGTLCGADNPCSHDICQSGQCVTNVPKAAGAACNDSNSCTQTDACDGAGACVGGNPVVCQPADACHAAGACDATTGACGAGAQLPGTCVVNGACFQNGDVNPANSCQVCDASQSATAFSNRPDNTSCDDGDNCTTDDICQSGQCVGTPVTCPAADQCHEAGVCDGATGTCTFADRPDNTSCNDGSPCTTGDTCQAGVCTGGQGCIAPAICSDTGCCTPDFSFQTPEAPCCSGISDILVPNLCEHQPLGGPCNEDRNCGFAIEPACCNGFCRDLSSDPLNCGACNTPIPFGAICIGGESVCQFPAPDFCPNPDRCVNLDIDLNNCGACGVHAPTGGVCLGGVPQCTLGFHNDNGVCCAAGLTNCGGTCVSLDIDLNNCGACGVQAPIGGVCIGGVPQCTPGLNNDNGRCCFTTEHNCGGCCSIFNNLVCPC